MKKVPEKPKTLPEHLVDYRKLLVGAEQKAQEDFDKTVLALSGAALGVLSGIGILEPVRDRHLGASDWL
jgi:hypothetical protein